MPKLWSCGSNVGLAACACICTGNFYSGLSGNYLSLIFDYDEWRREFWEFEKIHAPMIVANILFMAEEFEVKHKKIEAESMVPIKSGSLAFGWKAPILFFNDFERIFSSLNRSI